MKPKLEQIELTREQSEGLIERVEHDRLTPQDRQQLAQLIRVFFWLTLTVARDPDQLIEAQSGVVRCG